MSRLRFGRAFGFGSLLGIAGLLLAGCHTLRPSAEEVAPEAPRELAKVSMPPYVIEPPDILQIDALRVVPLPPYRVQPLDALFIQATDTLPTEPIAGVYAVEPDGLVNLGASYGGVRVVDMTLEEARAAIEQRLKKVVRNPQVSVSLAQSRANQQIRGQHLVRPDGTADLGLYGSVYVAGKTLPEAKAIIEQHLSQYLYKPEVAVDVFAYNSKVYYVITDGAGAGEQVVRVSATGNETVLDAISQINGLPAVASKKRIWVARPAPAGHCPDQVLPVDWCAITRGGRTTTNYQVMPGDRIYVMAQPLVTADTYLGRFIAPIERIFGIVLLGNATVQSIGNSNSFGGNNTGTGIVR
jgi:polysaccharide export outer membrane protein